ncbi:alpha/beta-hydrolase [Parathielavia hyrcaniae]|uniref:Alpha/beta-hydrolase n=1 Tax=Parathielavia hyrcaniae TaxID=113614 RepID=A0AAN6PW38_9PEZI|nr:alpha/beta-hydrolase [Parathielavia hyrcaniae]
MAIFTASDGARLFYRYYTPSTSPHRPATNTKPTDRQPLTVVFLHGWPLSSRMFDQLIVPLVETYRFPVIAPDRRGFGNSDWTTPDTPGDVTFDTFSHDAVALLEHVLQKQPDPGPFVFVASSMGTAESVLAHAASSFLREHCRGFVWLGASMPYPVRCAECPDASSPERWEAIIEAFRGAGGKEFVAEQVPGIFRLDMGNQVGARTLKFFEGLVGQADPVALERTAVILQKNMAAELRQLAEAGIADEKDRVPVLIIHGEEDAGMPLDASAVLVHQLIPWSQLKVYEKAGHGLYLTHDKRVLEDMLAFLEPIAAKERQ